MVLGAAARGKHVVSANKALLAAALPEVRRAFSSRARQLGYEAAVCGGVPVVRALQHGLAPDACSRVVGILNGTTNHILCAMGAGAGATYADALAGAQAAGFAETDPSSDVLGLDARNKLVLLAQLAFGAWVPPERVRTEGIAGVTPFDWAAAGAAGYVIKLLGIAEQYADAPAGGGDAAETPPADAPAGGSDEASAAPARPPRTKALLDMCVTPALVARGGPLAVTHGASNLVHVDSTALQRTTLSGQGAGRAPTAASVFADLLAIAKGTNGRTPFPRPTPARVGRSLKASDTLRRTFYVRGPPALVHLLSLVLWRQGSRVQPCGAPHGGAPAAEAFVVAGVSHRELASLVRRAARKVHAQGDTVREGKVDAEGDADAAEGAVTELCASVATWPIIEG